MHPAENQPLPGNTFIFRMCSSDFLNCSENLQEVFNLSTEDKKSEIPHLSAYETSLTKIEQAKLLTSKDLEIKLSVNEIRKIKELCLNVNWFCAKLPNNSKDCRPGAIGHCGIIGLFRPDSMPRTQFRKARIKLADMARTYWEKVGYI
jgi:hypothetical protein